MFCRYGFRSPPLLELKARPKLGEREVTFAHVTDWIEKKLEQEFQVQTRGALAASGDLDETRIDQVVLRIDALLAVPL